MLCLHSPVWLRNDVPLRTLLSPQLNQLTEHQAALPCNERTLPQSLAWLNLIYECSIMQLWLLNVLALTIHQVHDESNWQYQCYHLKEVIFIKLFWCVDSSNNYFYIFKLVVHLLLSITFFTGIDVWYFSTFLHYMIMMTANIHYIRSYKIQPVRWKETMHLYCSREAYHS